ncbi:MAG: PepSY-like domain-containing protein [Rikenellaceae bacterium]
MKKLLSTVVTLLLSTSVLLAEERVIDQSTLPNGALSFITEHYPNDKITIATMDKELFNKDYSVILTNDVKIEFDDAGKWSEVECKRNSEVPASIIPTKVASYIKDRFPSNKIVKINRDNKSIEVELNNDIELKFNNKGDLVEIDN